MTVGVLTARLAGVRRNWFRCVATALLMLGLGQMAAAEAKPKFSAIAIDARRGTILFGTDVDGLRHPASLTKMMTLYVLFQDLKAGRIKLKTNLVVSARASRMAPSKLGLKPGARITVDDAIKALVTKSANDVAATIAENLGGSEANFAARMTRTARSIGMSRSTFLNASGLPNPNQWTTARDMATLGLRLQRDFPQYYPYFRITAFNYKGRLIKTHNRLLGRYAGTDGIKTGYIAAAGFNLTTSAKRGDKRVVGVVLGARSGASRNAYMMTMLDGVFPRCVAGRTIAAKAGSSSGAVDPLALARADVPAVKPKLKPAAPTAGVAEEAEEPTALRAVTADPPAPSAAETKVLEAKIVNAANAADATATANEDDEDANDATASTGDDSAAATNEGVAAEAAPEKLPFQVKKQVDDVAALAPEQATTPTSWAIQVGEDFSAKTAAKQKLMQLKSAGYGFLKGKSAETVEVQRGDDVIYRARFIGFNQKTAKTACSKLAREGFQCMTMAPKSQS